MSLSSRDQVSLARGAELEDAAESSTLDESRKVDIPFRGMWRGEAVDLETLRMWLKFRGSIGPLFRIDPFNVLEAEPPAWRMSFKHHA